MYYYFRYNQFYSTFNDFNFNHIDIIKKSSRKEELEMISSVPESLIVIFVIAFTTFLTRVIPFILFPDNKKTPAYIIYLGNVLPYAIMGMLVIYCLKGVSVSIFPFGIPELISVIFVVAIQLWKRNTLLSISSGTILYMIFVQFIFI